MEQEAIPPPTAAPDERVATPRTQAALARVRDPSKETEYDAGGRPARDTQRQFDPRPVQIRVPGIEFASNLEAARSDPALAGNRMISKKNVEGRMKKQSPQLAAKTEATAEAKAGELLTIPYDHEQEAKFTRAVQKIRDAGLDPMTYGGAGHPDTRETARTQRMLNKVGDQISAMQSAGKDTNQLEILYRNMMQVREPPREPQSK